MPFGCSRTSAFHGVRVIYISQHIDSANEQAETLVAVHGVVDWSLPRDGEEDETWARGPARSRICDGFDHVRLSNRARPRSRAKIGRERPSGLAREARRDRARRGAHDRPDLQWYAAGLGTGRLVARPQCGGLARPSRRPAGKTGPSSGCSPTGGTPGKLIWGQKTFDRRPGTQARRSRPTAPAGPVADQWNGPSFELCLMTVWPARPTPDRLSIRQAFCPPRRDAPSCAGGTPRSIRGICSLASCGAASVTAPWWW